MFKYLQSIVSMTIPELESDYLLINLFKNRITNCVNWYFVTVVNWLVELRPDRDSLRPESGQEKLHWIQFKYIFVNQKCLTVESRVELHTCAHISVRIFNFFKQFFNLGDGETEMRGASRAWMVGDSCQWKWERHVNKYNLISLTR